MCAILSTVDWKFKGIIDIDNHIHPIPKNIQIQALFEYLAIANLNPFFKNKGCAVLEAENTRQYPDLTIKNGDFANEIVALDVKTSRRINDKQISGFTIGSYAGYFRSPGRSMPGCRLPYGAYTQHWIAGFIYDWNDNADTLNMVSSIEYVFQEKWRMASKTTGTGTTTAIASIRNIDKIRRGMGDFNSEEEFLSYWRNKPLGQRGSRSINHS